MEGSSGLSKKSASGKVGMDSGPLAMTTDIVATSTARSYDLLFCLWERRLFIMEVII